jgi:hypothetical protein
MSVQVLSPEIVGHRWGRRCYCRKVKVCSFCLVGKCTYLSDDKGLKILF